MRAVPAPWIAQTRPGGKILTTLGGWLYGHARVLLTVEDDGTAAGPLLPGTVSFMAARTHQPPSFGNPAHWASLHAGEPAIARHTPAWSTEATAEAFFTRFLVQCAVPDAQLTVVDEAVHLVDVVSGSVATLAPCGDDGWEVRQSGRRRLWDRVETVLDAYEAAGRPGPETFRLSVTPTGQYLHHPDLPELVISAAR